MGERIGASIQFGGKLHEADVNDLIQLIEAHGLLVDDYDPAGRENLGQCFMSWEVNYGNLDDLEDFGRQNNLHYRYWHDSGPDWVAATYRHNPEHDTYLSVLGSHLTPSLGEPDISHLGSMHAIAFHFAEMRAPLPPLEIVP